MTREVVFRMVLPLPRINKIGFIQELNRFCLHQARYPIERKYMSSEDRLDYGLNFIELGFTDKSDATLFKLQWNP